MRTPPTSPLVGVPPLSARSRWARAALEAHTDVLHPGPGTVLAREGTPAREVLVVVAGEVRTWCGGVDRGLIGPGTVLGAAAVLAGGPHPVTAVAGPGVELRVVEALTYRGVAAELPAVAPPGPPAGADRVEA